MPTFMMSLNWTDQGIRAVRIRRSAQKTRGSLPKRWASKSSIFISRRVTAISSSSSMHRAVTMSLNSRWRLAPLGMCAPARFARGQQMNIGSSFPSYHKRLRISLVTSVALQSDTSFDHFVSAGEQGGSHAKIEHPGGLEIDHPLELGPLLNRQIGWFCPLKDFVDVGGRAVPHIFETDCVGE